MFCRNCGKLIEEGAKFCPACGTVQNDSSPTAYVQQGAPKEVYRGPSNISPKSRSIVAILAFFLGGIGIHRFYVGKVGTALLQIILTACFGLGVIWALIDFIVIICGNFTDKQGLLITEWTPRY